MVNKDILKTRITGIHAVIEFDIVEPYFEKYGTEEYWNKLQKSYQKEIDKFNEFIRDHRSRDSYAIYTETTSVSVCNFCGYEWPEGFDGTVDCCQEALEAQGIDITYTKEANDE